MVNRPFLGTFRVRSLKRGLFEGFSKGFRWVFDGFLVDSFSSACRNMVKQAVLGYFRVRSLKMGLFEGFSKGFRRVFEGFSKGFSLVPSVMHIELTWIPRGVTYKASLTPIWAYI